MTSYLLTTEAEQDLEVIKIHLLTTGGSPLVRHVLGQVERALAFLGGTPGAGHRREDLTDDPVRFWQVFSYLIIYDPVPRPIHILRVLHTRRDIAAVLR